MSLLILDAASSSSSSSSSSPKDCSKRGLSHHLKSKLISKKLLLLLSTPLISLLLLLFLLWLTLHPSNPQFSLKDAALLPPPPPPSSSSSSSPYPSPADLLLPNATITAAVAARNPNAHAGVFYDRLRVRAACDGEPAATAEAAVPGFYQDPRGVTVVSAVMRPTTAAGPAAFRGVQQERSRILVEIRLEGRLRWKVGMWVSGGYGFQVDCLAVVEVVAAATSSNGPLSSLKVAQCSTNV